VTSPFEAATRHDPGRPARHHESSNPMSIDPRLLEPGSFVVFCDGGFANRVNCLVGGLVLAERLKLKPRIVWPRNNRCGAAFGELFTNDAVEVHEARLQDFVPVQRQLQLWLHENDVGFTDPVAPLRRRASLAEVQPLLHGDDRAVLYTENIVLPWMDAADVQRVLQSLRFQPAIVERAREVIARHGGDGYVGIHLRATDFTSPPPVEAMLGAVQAQSQTRFFVCSDDAAIEARFRRHANVFVHEKAAYVAKRVDGPWRGDMRDSDGLPYSGNIERNAESVVLAAVDLLLLAGSRPVKTSNSSFLALAEQLRACGWAARHLHAAAPVPAPNAAPEPSPFTSQNEIIEVLNLLRPYSMATDHKVRIGGDADGGYVMPSMALKSTAVVSIGIGDQVSFDAELADRGATVLQYDHTIPGAPREHRNFRFHKQGWGPKDEGPLLSLGTMMRGIDWEEARVPILKFDTEGAEWASLTAASSAELAKFAVIAGEFHGFHNLVNRAMHDVIRAVLEKIRCTHLPVHLHANNATGIRLVLGVPVPPLLEITFVRRDLAVFAGHSNEPIPGPLDRPNMADRPDICLRPF
jgi:hypothetical protein